MPTESVRIDKKVLDRCRVLATREHRPLSWMIAMLLEAALNGKKPEKPGK